MESADTDLRPTPTDLPRKWQCHTWQREDNKHSRLSLHVTGDDCKCKCFKYLEKINSVQRKIVVDKFNNIQTKNLQDAYLCGLISNYATKRHRIRGDPEFATMKELSYQMLCLF